MNDELEEGVEGIQSWPKLMYYPDTCLEGLRKITRNLSQYSRSLERDLNRGTPEFKVEMLANRLQRDKYDERRG